ncbi:MAG: repressor LexA [Anaerolineaceae bacterium]|nr:repressor LexA [Anaerolineaceae bacterium]
MAKKGLSERQKNILAYIQEYVAEFGRPPTIREIGSAVNISSTSVVNYNLTKLKERGLLERDAEVSRGLRLTDKVVETTGQVRQAVSQVAEKVGTAVSNIFRVPLVGNIVAGSPIEGVNGDFSVYDEDDMIELSTSMIPGRHDDLFALRVSGDSMIDAMVNDGDIVIMRQENDARNGDMVAVWLSDDTTTLKYFYREANNKIRLQPANPTMEPIYVDREEVQVQGKVMMVLRNTA